MGKISKSRGGGPLPPIQMIDRYSADAVRYWAVSTGLGKDAVISETKIQLGGKLTTKLWNVARFSERFITNSRHPEEIIHDPGQLEHIQLTPADRWILSRLQNLVDHATRLLDSYDYAAAKSEIEVFFWNEFADNYLEMCKQRLYTGNEQQVDAASFTLHSLMLTIIKLFAPFMPYVTEAIYQGIFADSEGAQPGDFDSIHRTSWPNTNADLLDESAEDFGRHLIEIATATRRYKSEHSLSLGTELPRLQIATQNPHLARNFEAAKGDLTSITRARVIEINAEIDPGLSLILNTEDIQAALEI